jgi:hypothetical protein
MTVEDARDDEGMQEATREVPAFETGEEGFVPVPESLAISEDAMYAFWDETTNFNKNLILAAEQLSNVRGNDMIQSTEIGDAARTLYRRHDALAGWWVNVGAALVGLGGSAFFFLLEADNAFGLVLSVVSMTAGIALMIWKRST